MRLISKGRLASIHPFAEFILSVSKGSRALSRRYSLTELLPCRKRQSGWLVEGVRGRKWNASHGYTMSLTKQAFVSILGTVGCFCTANGRWKLWTL